MLNRKGILCCSVLLLTATQNASALDTPYELTLNTGYATGEFNWHKASELTGTQTPNILSELNWSDLKIRYADLDFLYEGEHDWFVQAGYKHGRINSGKNQDSDYLGDNRTEEFSRSNNGSAGYLSEMNTKVGYHFYFVNKPQGFLISVTPYLGYHKNLQHLKSNKGSQTIPATGSFSGLDSFYEAQWEGPFVGFEVALLGSYNTLTATFEHYNSNYDAHGDWNLRDDREHPKSFEHSADGKGWVGKIKFERVFKTASKYTLAFTLEAGMEKWETGSGVSQSNFVDGTRAFQRLNEATWETSYIGAGLNYRF